MEEGWEFFRVRQMFGGPALDNPSAQVTIELERLGIAARIGPGESVAITAGSRGIANFAQILRATVDFVKNCGGVPFLVPAMGSHGGATAEGQLAVLARYGVTPESMGCPIRSSMDTVEVCQAREGFPIHFDRHAFAADHVIVVNRIKPHTGFTGEVQSGLCKMLLIGLGKHVGASIYHRAIKDNSFDQILRGVADEVIARCRILCGLAIVENGYEQTALVEAVLPQEFLGRERALLERSQQWLARLPFDELDLLIVDEIGKDISGTGLDTNVVGRKSIDHGGPGERPWIKRIYVRGLSAATHGNASGIGVAEFTRSDVVAQVDWQATFENCVTAGHPTAGMLPVHYATDRDVLQAVLRTIGLRTMKTVRAVWIRNTLDLEHVECSRGLFDHVLPDHVRPVSQLRPVRWDSGGNWPRWSDWLASAD
ncbi:MAG: DUF362 domain-containing protein [Pirellulales bacterium]